MAALAPFIRAGLERGERCVYVCDDNTAAQVAEALGGAGVDVERELGRGALRLLIRDDGHLAGGQFSPQAMIGLLRGWEEQALADGFTGLRLSGEMTWALGPEAGCERVAEYEALLNRHFAGSRAVGICQYNRERMPAEVIEQVLQTHPVAVVGDRVISNICYEPPEVFLDRGATAARVDWKIGQLRRAYDAEERIRDSEERYRLAAIAVERRRAEEELLQARDAAETASHAKSQFLAVMSHELRTPLTGIIGYADLLGADIWGPTTDQQRTQIARIKTAAWHLVSIIEEILTFSRVEAGKEEVALEAVDLERCVRESVELLQPQAAAKGIELRVVDGAAGAEIETDVGKLRQIVLNLAGNAVKFTDQGYVELSVESGDDGVVLAVRDTGPGIPVEQIGRIFDPFVQVGPSHTRLKGGTGLGLTVCRSLAQLLGGDVRVVESTPGAGTTFALRLPRRPAREVAAR